MFRHVIRIAAFSVAALGASPSAALADASAAQMPAGLYEAARSSWPGSPCAGREDVTIMDRAAFDAAMGQPGIGGHAWYDGSCRVLIAADQLTYLTSEAGRAAVCTLVAHEFGHLAGYRHSDDPADVMWPEGNRPSTPACSVWAAAATDLNPPSAELEPPPPMTLSEARHAVRIEYARRVTISCRWVTRGTTARCIAAAWTARRERRRTAWKVTAGDFFPRARRVSELADTRAVGR